MPARARYAAVTSPLWPAPITTIGVEVGARGFRRSDDADARPDRSRRRHTMSRGAGAAGVRCRRDFRDPPWPSSELPSWPMRVGGEHHRPAARRDRAARPAPAVQHRSPDRRAGRRETRVPRSNGSVPTSTCGCCRRSPTRSRTSTPGRQARSGCRRRRCWRCSTTSGGAWRRRRRASWCSSTATAATRRWSASPTVSSASPTG
jgi:hypothetical protein